MSTAEFQADGTRLSQSLPLPRVGVLIVFHANPEATLRCIASVTALEYPSLEIIAVDDGSSDGTGSAVVVGYPHVRLLSGDGTLWCNGGFNLAVRDCLDRGFTHVLLLNNDNTISPSALKYLMQSELSQGPCVVGSVVACSQSRNIVSYAGNVMDWSIGELRVPYHGSNVEDMPEGLMEVDCMGFQGVLIPRAVFESIGLIDDCSFKHYSGDVDFYLRAKRAGFKILIDTRSVVWEDLSTKGPSGPESSLIAFLRNLWSVRSTVYIPSRYRLYRRHSPHPWWLTFSRFYFRLAGQQLRVMSKHRLRQLQGEGGSLETLLRRMVQ